MGHIVINGNEIPCLDYGFVALVDVMGNDRTPAQTARTSFRNRKERTAEEDAKLTDYLIRNHHNTPEPIEVIEAWDLDFLLGNAVKYMARAGKKDPAKTVEDLKKAEFYLKRKIENLSKR